MIRGTTPTLRFTLPFDTDFLEKLYITAAQNGETVFEKDISTCELDGTKVRCRLTQVDTLSMTSGAPTEIQVRCKTATGDALASHIYLANTGKILKDGEI